MIGEYQFNNLPCPVFSTEQGADEEILSRGRTALRKGDMASCWSIVRPLLDAPPFSPAVQQIIVEAVTCICEIEAGRGDIARNERSHLDPRARPYQDLIDRILYALAGISEEESKALEQRLAKML